MVMARKKSYDHCLNHKSVIKREESSKFYRNEAFLNEKNRTNTFEGSILKIKVLQKLIHKD